jgi:hypothetical protein
MRPKSIPFTVKQSDLDKEEERQHNFSPLQWVQKTRDIEKQLRFFEQYPHGE